MPVRVFSMLTQKYESSAPLKLTQCFGIWELLVLLWKACGVKIFEFMGSLNAHNTGPGICKFACFEEV